MDIYVSTKNRHSNVNLDDSTRGGFKEATANHKLASKSNGGKERVASKLDGISRKDNLSSRKETTLHDIPRSVKTLDNMFRGMAEKNYGYP